MNFLENYYQNTIKYDLLNKFFYKNIKEIPEIKKIILNFDIGDMRFRDFAAALTAIELVTTKKGIVTKTKNSNLFLKLQKGKPVGCKIILKKMLMYDFLMRILFELILIRKKNFLLSHRFKNCNSFSMNFNNQELTFYEFDKHYYLHKIVAYLNITIVTNTKSREELFFLLKSFNLPL